ncbi:MAG: SDR family NAD(P)-dependent oxidoreductase, partial [Bacillota bacterium]|nr:SDR family NAD(P)-dependent oxidoreductase [Bacillota bacterium]
MAKKTTKESLKRLMEGILSSEDAAATKSAYMPESTQTSKSQGVEEKPHNSDKIREDTSSCLYFCDEWIPSDISSRIKGRAMPGRVLLLYTDDGMGNPVINGMEEQQIKVIAVKSSDSYKKRGNLLYDIRFGNPEDYSLLMGDLEQNGGIPAHIVFMGSQMGFSQNDADIETQLQKSIYSLFYLCRQLISRKRKEKIKLLYIYTGGKDFSNPFNGAISSFLKTVQMEAPYLQCGSIQLPMENRVGPGERYPLVDILRVELLNDSAQCEEARYEDRIRFVKSISECRPSEDTGSNVIIRHGGVYIITGGMGGLGLIFARYLAEKSRVKLVLTGRSDLNAERQSELKRLEDTGTEALYIKADISIRKEAADVIKKAKARFGKINGIIHSAGLLRDSFIVKKTADEINQVFGPKIYGTLWLDEETKNEELDFFAMFSSIASMGSIGQGDYAYGNRFMDLYAGWRENEGRSGKSISIGWPLWKDGGMKADREKMDYLEQTMGLDPLESRAGVKAFETALSNVHPAILVLNGDHGRIRSALEGQRREVKAPAVQIAENGSLDRSQLKERSDTLLKDILSRELKMPMEKIDIKQHFENYGIDSIIIMSLTKELEKVYGVLPKTLFFEYQNVSELSDYFVENHKDILAGKSKEAFKPQQTLIQPRGLGKIDTEVPKKRPFLNRNCFLGHGKFPVQIEDMENEIAIIGLSGRYPMAKNLQVFWNNLLNGMDCIVEIPVERWDHSKFFDPDKNKAGKAYSKWGGFIEDVDKFDPLFFNISPKEAEMMDPQERLFLETVWQTIEDAGYTRSKLERAKVGVFVGVMYAHYQLFGAEKSMNGIPMALGYSFASIANRVSYCLNLHGPSIALDTMCSSSLTSIHLACESLRKNESDMAIAGGVNVSIHPNKYILLSQGKFASTDGRCRSFGEGGDGYVPGEGVGAALLKPLRKAVLDGDIIYAVIKGTSLNHGGKTNSYTVPNPNAQAALITEALKTSNIQPRTISYIEAHGTGTSLGDPIEIAGMVKAFESYTKDRQFCSIGSVKSNIGHLESAAGIAGITKILLQMKNKKLVPSIHSEKLNTKINFEESPFFVQREVSEWKRPVVVVGGEEREYPRRAGVSAFGAGGSNAHVILEEYEQPVGDISEGQPNIVVLSARDIDRLRAYAQNLYDFLKENGPVEEEIKVSLSEIPGNMQNELVEMAAEVLEVKADDIDVNVNLEEYGFEPVKLTELAKRINLKYCLDIIPDSLYECATLQSMSRYLFDTYREEAGSRYADSIKHDKKQGENTQISLNYIAYTLCTGREAMEERLGMIVDSIDELCDKLLRFVNGDENVHGMFRGNIRMNSTSLRMIDDVEEETHFIRTLASNRKLAKLAQLWVHGAEIDWEFLFKDSGARRVSLPTYPFARERYWVPEPGNIKPEDTGFIKIQKLHPLIDLNVSNFKEFKYTKKLTGNEFFLTDHVVFGKKVLPGAVYLEMARAAGEIAGERTIRLIKSVVWLKPFHVSHEPRDISICLTCSGDTVEYVINHSIGDGIKTVYAQGRMVYGAYNEPEEAVYIDVEDIKSRCLHSKSGETCYMEYENMGFVYGPAFKCMTELHYNNNEALSRILLPEELKYELNDYILHPALVDGAFQTVIGLLEKSDGETRTVYM